MNKVHVENNLLTNNFQVKMPFDHRTPLKGNVVLASGLSLTINALTPHLSVRAVGVAG